MSLTYEKFKNLVPEETIKFVSNALPYLDGYLRDGIILAYTGDKKYSNSKFSKANFLLLYCLSNMKEYSVFLKKYGFDPRKYKINTDLVNRKGNIEEMFDRYSGLFALYQDETLYASLNPLDIVAKAFDNYLSNCNNFSVFGYLFPLINYSNFKTELEKKQQEKRIELEHATEKEIYGTLPISVVSYLETASKIRTLLFSNLENDQDLVKLSDEDIVPMSLLIALYHYEDTTLNEQSIIRTMLQEKGINIDKILNAINLRFYVSTVKNEKKNVYALKQLYMKYYNDKINDTDITVSKILDNVFNRSFTNSFAVEKVLAKLNCEIGAFIPVEETVQKLKGILEHERLVSYVKSFYAELSKESKDFIEFTAKAYLLILEKMKEKTHNMEVLVDEDDADTLALYIACCYHNVDVSEFFKDYGVTLEKVLEFLNLHLTKEEIDAMKLNQRVLVDRYKRFVYEGVNQNKSAKTICITDIAHNLCNREFNKSMIMENIFSELTKEGNLESDFQNQMKQHLEKKEQMRKMRLTQRLFKDMPASTMEYLENVSRIHQYLMKSLKQYNETDIQVFSLLLGLFVSPKNEIAGFFESKNMAKDSVCKYLNVSSGIGILVEENSDIDILREQYGNFIFGGYNKDLERKDLTISNIGKNIFSKSVYNSVLINKFLGTFELSYEDFKDIDKKFQIYLEETIDARKVSDGKSLLNHFNGSTKKYIENVIKIHQRLIRIAYQDESVAHLIPNISDVRELSLLLGTFTVENDVQQFFEKNKVMLENVCSFIGLQSDIVSHLDSDNIDYRLVIDVYEPFIKYGSSNDNKTASDLISKIFDKKIGTESLVLEEIVSFVGSNYDILKEEVETKKAHELSLTIDERIKILSEESVDLLDLSDVKSILHFGNSLSIHSKYIHDELPRLIMSDANDKSVEAISGIVDKVYTKVLPKKKSFPLWKHLFTVSVSEEEPRVVLNPDAIKELKEAIEANIEALSKELLGYDSIRRYIEVYRRKNRSYLIVAMSETERIEREVQGLNPEKEEEYATFLISTSKLQIMKDKSNHFSTSNHLMKQELLKVNQAIVNHFITINALEMARDDLLPLIGSELALTQGRSSENKGLDLSENIIGLFQSLLSRNVTSAVENMEKLKHSSLSEETFALLNRDIEIYLKGLNQVGEIEGRVEALDIDQITTTLADTPKLEYAGETMEALENSKQKILEYPKE